MKHISNDYDDIYDLYMRCDLYRLFTLRKTFANVSI